MNAPKVGIMTFWETNENYGQLAQACALQIFLEEHGFDPFLIKYDKSRAVKAQKPGWLEQTFRKDWTKLLDPEKVLDKVKSFTEEAAPAPDRHFDDFKADFIKFHHKLYSSPEELRNDPPEADIYITGSDQVWNHLYTGDPAPFLLQFGADDTLRVAFSASFGHKSLPTHTQRVYQNYLRSFDAVSVREKSGVDLCQALGYEGAVLLPDPTLLIARDRWEQYKKPVDALNDNTKKRVLIYTIGNRSEEIKAQILNYMEAYPDAEITHVSINKDRTGNCHPTVPQWLELYHKADLVITNSYHGMLFSIIFNNKFIVLPSGGDKKGMNERLYTTLEKVELEDRLLTRFVPERVEQLIQQPVDWQGVNEQVKDWSRQADVFIERLPVPAH
ncbi:polysaccharide pyruvyl transferase family protein [Marinoscillum furvescens]|uniref:Polysaccharide pyruvyl transferase n=1 Tax=Marinoscillum furvescens DSM 4134 TaxID=1122208 RepID=A0A3D9L3Z1_MARFU|nr:polysaccharide pyruvyl transferase family protein [Marinoscillum furvescens]RED97068.1 polysaccharide pyruvyl transferase [Marinoscillum furvescens DSM 4134]